MGESHGGLVSWESHRICRDMTQNRKMWSSHPHLGSHQEAADWPNSSEGQGSMLAWPAMVLQGQMFLPLVPLALHLLPPPVHFLWPPQHPWELESWSLRLSCPCFTSEDSPERHRKARADTGLANPWTHLPCSVVLLLPLLSLAVRQGGCDKAQNAWGGLLPLGCFGLRSEMANHSLWPWTWPQGLVSPHPPSALTRLWLPRLHLWPLWGGASQTVLPTISCHSFLPQRPASLPPPLPTALGQAPTLLLGSVSCV